MSTNIGPRIGIDGYNTYKAEMKSIIAQIEQYKAQCDQLSNSEEDLRTKQDLLSKEIKLQTDLLIKQAEWNAKVRQAVDQKATITARDTAAITENQTVLTRQETELNKLVSEYDKTTKQIDEFNGELAETADNAEDSSGRISGVTIALGELLAKAVEKGAQLVKQAAEIGINYNASMETYTAAFTTLLGDADKAEDALDRIRSLSKVAPTFSTDSLAEATQMIIATGRNAETATTDIQALANAVAASGGGNDQLKRMAQNLQQISNAGKATSIDIRQFAYAGIDVYSLLADYTGKATEEVSGMVVTYDQLVGALKYAAGEGGRYFGGLENQAETFNGQISALKKNVTENLGAAFEGVTNTLTDTVLPKINEFLSDKDSVKTVTGLIEDFGVAIATFSTAEKFNHFLNTNETAVGLLTGKISAADVATGLWSKTLSLLPAASVAAGVLILKNTIQDYNRAAGEFKNSLIGQNDTLEDVQANLAAVQKRYDKFLRDNTTPEFGTFLSGENLAIDKGYKEAIKQLQEQEQELLRAKEIAEKAAAEPSAKMNAIIENAKFSLDELKAAYDEYYESAMKAVQKEFDLFEEVGKFEDLATTKELTKNLQTQIDFWEQYRNNLSLVSDVQSGLSQELLAFLSDGSYESAGYLQSIVTDIAAAGGVASEGGQQIITDLNTKFSQLQEAQGNYAEEAAVTLSGIKEQMTKTVDEAIEDMKKLEMSDDMYNNGVSTLNGYMDGLRAQIPTLNLLAYNWGVDFRNSMQNGVNSSPVYLPSVSPISGRTIGGIANAIPKHAKGLDYVPEDNYIAALHKGEMILTAAQANAVRSGAYQRSIASKAYNYGGVNINVYAKEGQSVREIARAVSDELQHIVSQKEGVYG